jgi:poly(A) polymerase/tRNA nucleotidyltransferase (CCA-adding enzyme)
MVGDARVGEAGAMIAELLADPGLAQVLSALPAARIVGGAVRDALLGRVVADIDLATPEPPEATAAALARVGLKAIPTGIAHGTITTVSHHRPFEITTLRRDVSTDGRHAVVAWTDDWRQDAARRDFTINAMFLSRDAVVHDYFGGQADLAAGVVRFVGDAGTRIAEDYLRILRFFRFQARYGAQGQQGAPDAAAVAAIAAGVGGLAQLSAERVWSELKRILAAPRPQAALRLMRDLGVLAAVLPEGADVARLAAMIDAGAPADAVLRLAALLSGDADALAGRLRLSSHEHARLLALRAGPVPAVDGDGAAWRRLLADEDGAVLADRSWLAGGFGAEWDAARGRLAAMARPVFPLEGRDVLALGVAPGPAVGAALRAVRAWWLAAGCLPDKAACLAELQARTGWGSAPVDDNSATRC